MTILKTNKLRSATLLVLCTFILFGCASIKYSFERPSENIERIDEVLIVLAGMEQSQKFIKNLELELRDSLLKSHIQGQCFASLYWLRHNLSAQDESNPKKKSNYSNKSNDFMISDLIEEKTRIFKPKYIIQITEVIGRVGASGDYVIRITKTSTTETIWSSDLNIYSQGSGKGISKKVGNSIIKKLLNERLI